MIENYKNEVSYLEVLVYRLNNLISYFLENSDEAMNLYKDYKAKKIDKDIKKDLERLKESEEYHRKGYAELYKRIDEAIEYIKEECLYDEEMKCYCDDLWCGQVQELVSILKGVDKE